MWQQNHVLSPWWVIWTLSFLEKTDCWERVCNCIVLYGASVKAIKHIYQLLLLCWWMKQKTQHSNERVLNVWETLWPCEASRKKLWAPTPLHFLYELLSCTEHHVKTNFFFFGEHKLPKKVLGCDLSYAQTRVDGAYFLNVIVANARVWRICTHSYTSNKEYTLDKLDLQSHCVGVLIWVLIFQSQFSYYDLSCTFASPSCVGDHIVHLDLSDTRRACTYPTGRMWGCGPTCH